MTHKTAYKKRILSLILTICMLFTSVPMTVFATETTAASTDEPTIVIAGSDLQYESSSGMSEDNPVTVGPILEQLKKDYATADGFLFAGDYDAVTTNDEDETETGIRSIKSVVREYYEDLTDSEMVLIQGNHDYPNNMLAKTGENDPESCEYGVYVINEDDYPTYPVKTIDSTKQGTEAQIQALASDLENYLNAKVENGYDRPIFVVSHLPLHYSYRTYKYSDGLYAKYLLDALNNGASKGLNIIFMFGHNHSSDYDNYLGGGAIYLKEGDPIWIANPSSNTAKPSKYELGFTYMNAGYVGFSNDDVDDTLTMTVFEITDTEVEVRRYSKDGLYNLKSVGSLNSSDSNYGYSAYTNVYTSPQTIELSLFNKVTISNNGVTVTVPGITGLEVEKKASASSDYKAYALYDITPSGYTQGDNAVVTILVSSEDGFDVNRPVQVIDVVNNTSEQKNIVNGKVTFTVNHFSEYAIAQSEEEINWVGIPEETKTIFRLTSELKSGETYVIADGNSGSVNVYNDQEYTVTYEPSGNYIEGVSEAAQWKYTSNGYLQNADNNNYLVAYFKNPNGNNFGLQIKSSTSGGYIYSEWGYNSTDNYLIANNSYYVTSDFSVATSAKGNIYIYKAEEKVITNASFVAMTGAAVHNITVNNYADWAAVEALIRNNITVYTASDNVGTNKVPITDYDLSGTVDPTVIGEYSVKVMYAGKELGTVTVHVNAVKQVSINLPELDSKSIKVGELKEVTVSADYTDVTYTWSSSNSKIAAVSGNGATAAITGVSAGVVKITVTAASATDGVRPGTKTFEIVVIPENATYIEGVGSESGYYYYLDLYRGAVKEDVKETAKTGANIVIVYDDGTHKSIPVTVGMLANADGTSVNVAEPGTFTGLNVKYGEYEFKDFTLEVLESGYNDYPEYPDAGSVNVKKTADGVEFQSSGVAKVELSAMGIPVKKGADFIIMIDTSGSMTSPLDDGKTRRKILEPALESLLTALQKPMEDGADRNLRVAIASFNGYDNNSDSRYYVDTHDLVKESKYELHENKGKVFTSRSGRTGTLTADAFVNVNELDTTIFTCDDTEITEQYSSGTNYDYAFDAIYELGAAIKAENADNGEDRDLFVLFMSDGTPFQYNYFRSSSDGVEAWGHWLHGTIDSYKDGEVDIYLDKNSNRNYYDYSTGNEHRMARAVKGAEDEQYVVIRKDANTDGEELDKDGNKLPKYMTKLPGLGATVFSIGLLVKEDTQLGSNTMEYVLKNVASSDDYYFDITSEEQLTEAFNEVYTGITYAATNARYVDTMGSYYDLQIKPFEINRGENDVETRKPVITVQDYEIYTMEDYRAGTITADKIGTRKVDRSGNYISSLIETVTFNDSGTEAYSNGDTSNNIMTDGIIAAKSFWYNTTSSVVMIDADGDSTTGTDGREYSLAPETFYWTLGKVNQKERALSYYVYLTGSMEGQRTGGSYPTNESAVLYYDNWLGHAAHKDTVSPVLPWDSANVSYAFYLVNEAGEIVVNQTTGQTGSFANRIAITNPVVFDDILLNNEDQIQSIEVASLGVLPTGYELYDRDAVYSITINSNSTGSWEITKGAECIKSTYVTGFSGGEYSNELVENKNSYDYAHTTVWFAVVWKIQAIPDTVVVDYGLPVDIGVLVNDMFGDYGTLAAVGPSAGKPASFTKNLPEAFATINNGTYGVASIPDKSSEVRYTLNTSNGMQMKEKETFAYAVNYKGLINSGYYYGDVTVIPASMIYYEDDFVTYGYNGNEVDLSLKDCPWITVGDSGSDITQEEDRPGEYSLPSIDGNNVYGNDDAYKTSTQYSLGSAKKVNLSGSNYATAGFDFYGTGFDVISLTSNKTGTLAVQVFAEGSSNPVKAYAVNTYYGYAREYYEVVYKYTKVDETNGIWVAVAETKVDTLGTSEAAPENPAEDSTYKVYETRWIAVDASKENAIYQIPVIKVSGLPYGKYHAVITGAYAAAFDSANVGSCDFYLDAIRIYDPAGVYAKNNAGNVDTTIKNAYVADGEGWPEYHELRNMVIPADSLDKLLDDTSVKGIVFIDGVGNTNSAADYVSYGPKNELYLGKNQSISFNMNFADAESVQIALKSLSGATEVLFANADNIDAASSITINTATDLYYDISRLNGKNVLIRNTGDGILSITNIKATYSKEPAADSGQEPVMAAFTVTRSSVQTAVMALRSMGNTGNGEVVEPTPEITPEVTPEVFVPDRFKVNIKKNVKAGETFKVTVNTSDDVAFIGLNGEVYTEYTTDKSGKTRTWTMELCVLSSGTKQVEVVAYDKDMTASNTVEKNITVKRTAGKAK